MESDSPSGGLRSADHPPDGHIPIVVLSEPVIPGELVARITHHLIETQSIKRPLTGEDLNPSRAS